ncbi:MAG: hypothetical protein FK730_06255 [Asgard group archaeon]|nr:hypothetical protein [Asgard group archaeon]
MRFKVIKLLFIKIILIALIVNLNSTIIVSLAKNHKVNSFIGPAPKIDGNMDDGEWDAAGEATEVFVYDIWTSSSFDLLVSSIHNETYLYIGSKANINNIYKGEITYYFHSNRALSFRDENWRINDGNDVKIIDSNSNCSFDGFTNNDRIIEDRSYGGSNDSEGKCYITDTSIMFELKIPFYSGDELGHDIYTVVEDEFLAHIEITVNFLEEVISKAGGSYRMPSRNTCKFILNNSTAVPIAFYSVIIGLISVAGILVIKNKRKKKIKEI